VRLGRSGPLDALAERQLELFAVDEAELLEEARTAERAWTDAGREDAEEAYGDYQLVLDAIADRLLELRDGYAATLADEAVATYQRAFARAVRRRFGRYATVVADLDDAA
jgi:hypothetical protein